MSEVILVKSGLNKKDKASLKAPFIIPYTTINIRSSPSIGIKIFTILPIPFFTPAETINIVKPINMVCHNMSSLGEFTMDKNCPAVSRSFEDAETKIYLRQMPAITL